MSAAPSGKAWVVSFHPLASTRFGIAAVKQYGLPPYIDGSCRREPDLLSTYPSITALCRKGKFAPRLAVGDDVVYVSVKGEYGRPGQPHHRYVARLRVNQVFTTHSDAATWYLSKGLSLPNNCLVPGNLATAYDQTHGGDAAVRRILLRKRLSAWEQAYAGRVSEYPVFIACGKEYLELSVPCIVETSDWEAALGQVPATETPRSRALADILKLETLVTNKPAPPAWP